MNPFFTTFLYPSFTDFRDVVFDNFLQFLLFVIFTFRHYFLFFIFFHHFLSPSMTFYRVSTRRFTTPFSHSKPLLLLKSSTFQVLHSVGYHVTFSHFSSFSSHSMTFLGISTRRFSYFFHHFFIIFSSFLIFSSFQSFNRKKHFLLLRSFLAQCARSFLARFFNVVGRSYLAPSSS